MKELLLFFSTFFTTVVFAQVSEIVNINFDACNSQVIGAFSEPIFEGSTNCDCGIEGQSLHLTDSNSAIVFDTTYTNIFQNDFTMSFYFMLNDNDSGIVDILSVSKDCQIDSSLTIKYITSESLLRIQMAKDFELFIELDAKLNLDLCWHHLVFQREDKNYRLFVDGKFSDSDFTNGQVVLDPKGTMKISKSPCQLFGETAFRGKIDEFKIFKGVLSVQEVFNTFVEFDKIITSDTTIFSGTTIKINHSESCADNLVWKPSQNVEFPNDIQPEISPSQTTKYFLTYDYGICKGLDSINISIIDQDLVNCSELMLPNAFTPNNDGLNDGYGISNAFIIEKLKSFEIFDRWGEKVFEATDKNQLWDGVLRGEKINSNIFLYKVNYTCMGEEFVKTGSLSVLR